MKELNPVKVGLTFGTLFGLFHLVWSLLVAFGLAQIFIGWILGLHFLNNPYIVAPFEMATAIMLVVMTSIVGFVMGAVFALIWNKMHSK